MPAPTNSVIIRSSVPMSIDTAINFVLGGITILLMLWLLQNQDDQKSLRIVNEQLAKQLAKPPETKDEA